MSQTHAIDFQAFDADNHYYEAEDAFTRHLDPRMARRAMQWAEVNGRKTLLVGGKVNRFIPNPTFDPVAKPGCLDEYFRGRNPEGKSIREIAVDMGRAYKTVSNTCGSIKAKLGVRRSVDLVRVSLTDIRRRDDA